MKQISRNSYKDNYQNKLFGVFITDFDQDFGLF